MLQRLFRGQSEQADAISTASDTLDAAIEDAQTQRDAPQAQRDVIQKQISELWAQDDELCRQMYELDQAIGDVVGEIGSTGVTVQVYSRGSSGRRAAGDDDIRRQLEDLNRQKGEVIRQWEEIALKYAGDKTADGDTLRELATKIDEAASEIDNLEVSNDELSEQMADLFAEAPDINENDFEYY